VDWIALRLDVPATLADAVANFLVEVGAPGVVTDVREADRPARADGRAGLEAHVPRERHPAVVAALERWLASVARLAPEAASVSLTSDDLPPVDWEAGFRRHHRPVAVGRTLLVAPPWDVPAAPGRQVLVIEPGMAFGTGQHATTRGCLEAIEAAVAEETVRAALDVGTGSGVLAAALVRLGVPRVVALDTDAAVLPLARTNLARNGAGRALLFAGSAAAVRTRFDLVVANLLADALVREAPALARTVAPGGRLVLSGILDVQAAEVERAYPTFRRLATHAEDAWRTLVLAREPR
jgi:ribosomal protein L11 methyltransferase